MGLRTIAANDRPADVAGVAYGPVVLAGGAAAPSAAMPRLDLGSIRRSSAAGGLGFTATADGKPVTLGPFYDAHGFNYNVYWLTSGKLPASV
jgi:hypothetical protein